MNIFEALILGLVEGVTEFLPISSTAHLLLVGKLLAISDEQFLTTFSIFIQTGAIAAVIWLYRWDLLHSRLVWRQLTVAFLPTVLIGLALYPVIKSVFLTSTLISIVALGLGGVFLIWFEKRLVPAKTFSDEISLKQAFWIGVAQSLAVVPGVSRAGATIVGGMFAGISRPAIVRFSFLLAVPTITGAAALDIFKSYEELSFAQFEYLLVGLITAFIAAMVVIKWLVRYVARNDFTWFGWYRIGIAIVLALILL